ncbi:MAG: hypothetical protein AB7S26_15260 [Sandaracinaceae bacterium]
MRTLPTLMTRDALLLAAAIALPTLGASSAGCGGGTDLSPAMPDPTVVDRSADDMDLPEASGPMPGTEDDAGSGGEDGAASTPSVSAGTNTAIEGTTPRIRIVEPRDGQQIRTGNVMLRLRLSDWELEPTGRHVHVIVDNEPYIAVRDVSQPIDLNALVQQNLGHELAEGTHVVRVFPSRGHHESVKTDGAFATKVFHFRSRTPDFEFDPAAPLLTYSRPKGCNVAGDRVLLDFYVSNTTLAADGNRVHYDIDGQVQGDITTWVPHWIEDLGVGEHSIQLQLRDANGEPVAGMFNDTTRVIRVASSCE